MRLAVTTSLASLSSCCVQLTIHHKVHLTATTFLRSRSKTSHNVMTSSKRLLATCCPLEDGQVHVSGSDLTCTCVRACKGVRTAVSCPHQLLVQSTQRHLPSVLYTPHLCGLSPFLWLSSVCPVPQSALPCSLSTFFPPLFHSVIRSFPYYLDLYTLTYYVQPALMAQTV